LKKPEAAWNRCFGFFVVFGAAGEVRVLFR
jgi:hypothetical protein